MPETLAFLVRQAGLEVDETRYLNEPPAEERMRPVRLPPRRRVRRGAGGGGRERAALNEVVFGPQDYAIVAHR